MTGIYIIIYIRCMCIPVFSLYILLCKFLDYLSNLHLLRNRMYDNHFCLLNGSNGYSTWDPPTQFYKNILGKIYKSKSKLRAITKTALGWLKGEGPGIVKKAGKFRGEEGGVLIIIHSLHVALTTPKNDLPTRLSNNELIKKQDANPC